MFVLGLAMQGKIYAFNTGDLLDMLGFIGDIGSGGLYLLTQVKDLGQGTIFDPFAGAGSTLAAAEAVGYESIGIEKDVRYFDIARAAIPKLRALKT